MLEFNIITINKNADVKHYKLKYVLKKIKYLELRMKRKVTEQALVRRAGLVTTATTLVLFPW